MIDHAADLADVFFGPDFAHPFTRQRSDTADVTVMLIFGLEDADALDDRARAARRVARFAAGQDVRVDDVLIAQQDVDHALQAGGRLRVIEGPYRVNDGREVEALLGSAPA